MILKTRKDIFKFHTNINTSYLHTVSRNLSAVTGISVQPNKAIVGKNAFAHEAGIHQDGVLKEKLTYEIMRPEDIGLVNSRLVLGKHSGRNALAQKLKILGYDLPPASMRQVFMRFKKFADQHKSINDEDLEMIVKEENA